MLKPRGEAHGTHTHGGFSDQFYHIFEVLRPLLLNRFDLSLELIVIHGVIHLETF